MKTVCEMILVSIGAIFTALFIPDLLIAHSSTSAGFLAFKGVVFIACSYGFAVVIGIIVSVVVSVLE